MSTSTSPTDADHGTGTPRGGILTDGQTYKNLLYLFLRFPLGVTYFTVLVTGATVGAVLAILLVGFVVLGLTIAGATYAGSLEALLANRLLGTDIQYEPHDPTEESLADYTKHVLTDVRSYVLLAYMLATFPVGLATLVLVVSLMTFTLVSVLAPFTYWLPFTDYQVADFGDFTVVVDTLPEALLLAVVGLVVGYLGLHLCNLLARAHGRVTATLLDQNR
jgi:hypothetical protein